MSIYDKRSMASLLFLSGGEPFFSFASVSGSTAVSAANMAQDFSAVPQEFIVLPPPDEQWNITNCMIFMSNTTGLARGNTYGTIPQLPNGIAVEKRKSGAPAPLQSISHFQSIRNNDDWIMHAHNWVEIPLSGSGTTISCQWEFGKAGRAIFLDGAKEEYITFIVSDDLSGMSDHRIKVEGFRRVERPK